MDCIRIKPLLPKKSMVNEKPGMATEPSQESLLSSIGLGALHFWMGLDILKFEQTSLFYSALYLNLGVELCFGGAKPIDPHGYGTVWKKFRLLFNKINSEKYLGYMICQACKVCQTFCL